MFSYLTFPGRHQNVMLDSTDPIHMACDFFIPSSANESLDLLAVNKWLHSRSGWAQWPDFLVAFASNGCGDYFAYDLRQTPPSIIYIGPDGTPEEHLNDRETLRYESFDEWYNSKVEHITCRRCGNRETRFEASPDKKWLLRICLKCEFQEGTEFIDL